MAVSRPSISAAVRSVGAVRSPLRPATTAAVVHNAVIMFRLGVRQELRPGALMFVVHVARVQLVPRERAVPLHGTAEPHRAVLRQR